MPVICIGPVCIPWTAVVPLLIWLFRPIFVRLPKPWQLAISSTADATRTWFQANLWDRVGWTAKAKKAKAATPAAVELTSAPAPARAAAAPGGKLSPVAEELLKKKGSLILLDSEEEWEAALEASRSGGVTLFVDYTASWCTKCHELKPSIEKLAAAHKDTLFVEVDVDELEDLAYENGAAALPMQEVYVSGEQVGRVTGNYPDKVEPMLLDALKKSS